jgi:hypothetical protein
VDHLQRALCAAHDPQYTDRKRLPTRSGYAFCENKKEPHVSLFSSVERLAEQALSACIRKLLLIINTITFNADSSGGSRTLSGVDRLPLTGQIVSLTALLKLR